MVNKTKFSRNTPEHMNLLKALYFLRLPLTEALKSLREDYDIDVSYNTITNIYSSFKIAGLQQANVKFLVDMKLGGAFDEQQQAN